jgi:hypothetical protein
MAGGCAVNVEQLEQDLRDTLREHDKVLHVVTVKRDHDKDVETITLKVSGTLNQQQALPLDG